MKTQKKNKIGTIQVPAGADAEYYFSIWEDGRVIQAVNGKNIVHETKFLKDVEIEKQKNDFCKLIWKAEREGYKLQLCSGCHTTYSTLEAFMVCEEGHKYCTACQKTHRLINNVTTDYDLEPHECPGCRKTSWFRRGKDDKHKR